MASTIALSAVLLVLMLIARVGADIARESDNLDGVGAAAKYWDKMLPGAAMPPSLRASLSPLDGSPAQAQLHAMNVKQAAASFNPATSAALCKARGLMCNPGRGSTNCGVQFVRLGQASKSKSDSATSVDEGFFLENDLVEGATTHLHGEHGPALHRAFFPKAVADVMPPLTSDNLPNLQRIFNIQGGTNMSAAMKEAVSFCEDAASLPGEKRACPTSLESMVAFVSSTVGSDVAVLEQATAPAVVGPAKIVISLSAPCNTKSLRCATMWASLRSCTRARWCSTRRWWKLLSQQLTAQRPGRLGCAIWTPSPVRRLRNPQSAAWHSTVSLG